MKNNLYILTTLLLLSACGGGSDAKDTQFYKKQETNGKWPHKTLPRLLWWTVVRAEVVQKMSSFSMHFSMHYFQNPQL